MILDSGDEVYVWIGRDATADEAGAGMELATKYLDSDPTDRLSNSTSLSLMNFISEIKITV